MARRESDREDLMREASGLVRRVELRLPDQAESIVAGFRKDGCLSIYFGASAAYHLDDAGRLRRAFLGGRLFRTQGSTLARLTRHRTPEIIELQRQDLTPDELASFRDHMRRDLKALQEALESERAPILRCIPAVEDLRPVLLPVIGRFLAAGAPLAPAIRGKR